MERIVGHAPHVLDKRIEWAVGGFDLVYADAARIVAASVQPVRISAVPEGYRWHAAKGAFRRARGGSPLDGPVGGEIGSISRPG
jgi:7,8-dihydropterin-6-yl-methyl-4-(beta-D-ribofuranosyl)aminobenzene 5'-phosphate synthase